MISPVFYCNNRVRAMLRIKLVNKSNTLIALEQWQTPITGLNRPTLTFQGVPVRRIDELHVAEARIT